MIGFSQKEMKPKELKMNQAKLRNMKIGLLEIIFFYDLSKQSFDFRTFKTIRLLVIIFITTELI